MKIIQLTAENIKRLKAVDITPDPNVQVVGGRNAQGKTSVLDAIWLALGGRSASSATVKPVRNGEEAASVRLDLGDLVVTRTWRGDKSTLTVTNADGAKYPSPQSRLDALIGDLSFDPLAFTRLSASDQREALLSLVDLDVDLDELAEQRKALFDERTDIGRQGKALGDVGEIDDDLPKVEQSASEIIRMIQARQERNREIEAAEREVEENARTIQDLARQIQELQARLKAAKDEQKKAVERVKFLGDVQPTDDLEEQLASIEETNVKIRENNARKAVLAQKAALRERYNQATEAIDELDRTKAEALAAAKFPVDGLGFDESGVTYRGVPFSQASTAEQIRVSLAMAMAANPQLRVIRILDGSLLDDESMALIREAAVENDFQIWVERVGDGDDGAVIIEEGQVKQ